MTLRGIEAIIYYIPPDSTELNINTEEERGVSVVGSNMASVERYKQEWTQLLETLDADTSKLREAACDGQLKVSKFRSIHWAILLRVLTEDYRSWRTQRALQRERYEKFKADFTRNPHESNLNSSKDDNPLSQSTESIWNQYFNDQELLGVIRQDVIRTFPGVDFFRKQIIQESMSNILFYYAREHPYMGYRQGMHEVLAPVIFVLYGDHQSLLHFKEISMTDTDPMLLDVINPRFLEADSYSLFSRIMSSVECYYRVRNIKEMDNHYGANANNQHTEAEIIGQLDHVRDKILAKEDLHLHNYLLKLDIPMHVFGIRWLRLLFGREFPLLDLLLLWDAVFANSDRFELPNYVTAAMLVHIREKLLLSDYATALGHLMRYPKNSDINTIISHALHMMNPKKFRRPDNVFTYVSITQQRDAEFLHQQKRTRSTSMQTTQLRKFDKLNAHTNSLQDYADSLSLELENVTGAIRIARLQLLRNVTSLQMHVAKYNSSIELDRAILGIEDVCNKLSCQIAKCDGISLNERVDQATEANEQQELRVPTALTAVAATISNKNRKQYEKPENSLSTNIVRLLASKREIEMTEISISAKTNLSPN